MSFYRTTPMTAEEIQFAVAACTRQEVKVRQLFRQYGSLTPSECWQRYGDSDVPLTSIRRAITDLTEAGLLVKTEFTRIGFYGRRESVWQIDHSETTSATGLPPSPVASIAGVAGQANKLASKTATPASLFRDELFATAKPVNAGTD